MTRIHIVAMPQSDISRAVEHDAYQMKVHRLARMMYLQDIPMFLYAGSQTDEETRARVTEDVPVVTKADRQRWWGVDSWPVETVFNEYDPAKLHWTEMNFRAADEIATRWQPGDLLGVISGLCQEQVGVELRERHGIFAPVVEWGIGYSGTIRESFKVFESHAWRHCVAGLYRRDDLSWYDTVIPNSYDPMDFIPWIPRERVTDGPLVFMARMTERKGLNVVRAIAATGRYEVITCGQGDESAEHRGLVIGKNKSRLLREALAVLSPTVYLGPFEGVSVEAMMAGTPAITTDWGVYTETIPDRYRATTLQEFLDAIELARTEDRAALQRAAWRRFGLGAVGSQYVEYFHKISALSQGIGWDALRAGSLS